MLAINKYKINVNLIPNLPQIPFRNGVGQYEGSVMHATAVWNDIANNERSYETTHFEDAFVHTFTDETQILQVADFNYVSWNAGKTANARYLGNELCQSKDYNEFLIEYDQWVWLAAYQLYQRKLGVIDGVTLLSHHQCTIKWGESSHTDPDDYLAYHGKKWADVVTSVSAYYKQFEEEEKMIQELQAQLQQLQDKVAVLEKRTGNEALADWSNPSIQKAFNVAQKYGQDFDVNEGTRDFHRIIVILDRMGLLDMALQG